MQMEGTLSTAASIASKLAIRQNHIAGAATQGVADRTRCSVKRPWFCLACFFAIVSGARGTAAQDVPITPRERTAWFATSVAGPRSLVAGLFVAGSETLIDVPPE